MSRSTNGSIIVHKEKSESVSLLSQFKSLEENINQIISTNENIEDRLETIHGELNQTTNDLQIDINLVSVSQSFDFVKDSDTLNSIKGKFEWYLNISSHMSRIL